MKREIESQRESIDVALRENTVLNETLRLKENLEEVFRASEESEHPEENTDNIENTE